MKNIFKKKLKREVNDLSSNNGKSVVNSYQFASVLGTENMATTKEPLENEVERETISLQDNSEYTSQSVDYAHEAPKKEELFAKATNLLKAYLNSEANLNDVEIGFLYAMSTNLLLDEVPDNYLAYYDAKLKDLEKSAFDPEQTTDLNRRRGTGETNEG